MLGDASLILFLVSRNVSSHQYFLHERIEFLRGTAAFPDCIKNMHDISINIVFNAFVECTNLQVE